VEPESGSPAETAACSASLAEDAASSADAGDELAWTPPVGAGFEVPPHATAAAPTKEKAKMMLSVRYIARRNLGGRSTPARDGAPRPRLSRVAASTTTDRREEAPSSLCALLEPGVSVRSHAPLQVVSRLC